MPVVFQSPSSVNVRRHARRLPLPVTRTMPVDTPLRIFGQPFFSLFFKGHNSAKTPRSSPVGKKTTDRKSRKIKKIASEM